TLLRRRPGPRSQLAKALGCLYRAVRAHVDPLVLLTWFPTYLVQARGMSFVKVGFLATLPFLAAFVGVLSSGLLSDALVRRGMSLGAARKTPIVVGLLLSVSI